MRYSHSREQFVQFFVVTNGELGSEIAVGGDRIGEVALHAHADAEPVAMVETCGAGDTYAAGVMYAWSVLEGGAMGK